MKIRHFMAFFCVCAVLAQQLLCGEDNIEISSSYPGGNAIVENIDQESNTVEIRQDMRDTKPWWFYWNFKAKNIGGKTVKFKFVDKTKPWRVIDAFGPAISTDGGKTWKWQNPKENTAVNEFSYTAPEGINEAQFSYCIPYLYSDFELFAKEFEGKNGFKVEPFCKTRQGRQNFCIKLNESSAKEKPRIFLASRHHACEATGSYVLEGFMRELFSDSEEGKALRSAAEYFIIPMMDLDGVENGDQGKSRVPHDHNRDYIDTPIYPSVAAAKKKLLEWESSGGTDIIIDFHSPSIGSKSKDGKTFSINSVVFLPGHNDSEKETQQRLFSEILEDINTSELPFLASDFLPFGKSWNKDPHTTGLARYGATLKGTKLSTSFETPYATCRGVETSKENLKELGRCVAKALLKYIKTLQ